MLEFLSRGGLIMIPIGLASGVGLTIFFERWWALSRSKVLSPDLLSRALELAKEGRLKESQVLCEANESALGQIFSVILLKAGQPFPLAKEAAEDAGRQQADRLERGISILGTVAAIAPLLGLLGTVMGMIEVFQAVAESGVGDPLEMAAGIWEALVSTACGLFVGIIALIGHRALVAKVDGLLAELEHESATFVDLVQSVQVHGNKEEPKPVTRDS